MFIWPVVLIIIGAYFFVKWINKEEVEEPKDEE